MIGRLSAVTLYTIRNVNDPVSEFDKFVSNHKDKLDISDDYHTIMKWIGRIGERGAFERYFRPESKIGDGVCAIPVESNALRLFALRICDSILILGNGGIKRTKTYNEDTVLNKHVSVLAGIDRHLKDKIRAGSLRIVSNELSGIDNVKFNVKIFKP
jgi:hypothetical protein